MAHNYSKHFGNNRNQESSNDHEHEINVVQQMTNQVDEVKDVVEKEEPVVENIEQEVVEVDGIVSGCEYLNVREESSKDANILCVIGVNTVVKVDLSSDTETNEFYKVITPNGVKGYCMKKFITIN